MDGGKRPLPQQMMYSVLDALANTHRNLALRTQISPGLFVQPLSLKLYNYFKQIIFSQNKLIDSVMTFCKFLGHSLLKLYCYLYNESLCYQLYHMFSICLCVNLSMLFHFIVQCNFMFQDHRLRSPPQRTTPYKWIRAIRLQVNYCFN